MGLGVVVGGAVQHDRIRSKINHGCPTHTRTIGARRKNRVVVGNRRNRTWHTATSGRNNSSNSSTNIYTSLTNPNRHLSIPHPRPHTIIRLHLCKVPFCPSYARTQRTRTSIPRAPTHTQTHQPPRITVGSATLSCTHEIPSRRLNSGASRNGVGVGKH